VATSPGNPVGKTHHRYTKEFRDDAVRLFRRSGKPLRPFCAELGIATESRASGSSRPTLLAAPAATGSPARASPCSACSVGGSACSRRNARSWKSRGLLRPGQRRDPI